MAKPLEAPMPIVDIGPGMFLQFEARDPTSGGLVTGVEVSDVGIYGPNLGAGGAAALSLGPFMMVPGPGA